jgi:hypothetical protein
MSKVPFSDLRMAEPAARVRARACPARRLFCEVTFRLGSRSATGVSKAVVVPGIAPSGRQNPREIDVLEAHWRDVVQNMRVDIAALCAPAVNRQLQLVSIPSHDQVRHQGQRTGLCDEFFNASAPARAHASTPDLPLQRMGALIGLTSRKGPLRTLRRE